MKFQSDIEVTGTPQAIEESLQAIEAAMGGGWKRVPEYEEEASAPDSETRCYGCTRSPRRAEAVVYLTRKGGSLSISNVAPTAKAHLSYEEYNIIVTEFYSRFVRAVVDKTGVRHRLLEADLEVRQYGYIGGARPAPPDRAPGGVVNPYGAVMHPLEEDRAFRSLQAASEEAHSPDAGALEHLLKQISRNTASDEVKGLLYALAQKYEKRNQPAGAKQVYEHLYRTDSTYRNVGEKVRSFETTVVEADTVGGASQEAPTMSSADASPSSRARAQVRTKALGEDTLSEKARQRYELIQELGRGAMGIVYKAHDSELDEVVALKILPENLMESSEALMRFRVEARAARKLTHPNIVRIHDIGEDAGRKYISMEYVDGGDLKKLFAASGRLAVSEFLHLMKQVCGGLDYAHSKGIVHRDIKPANILLTEDLTVKISDFGIAKIIQSAAETVTQAGTVIGTPLYMCPEQLQGLPVDNRADIYSLGIMMYELISGHVPFRSGDIGYQHVHMAPQPVLDIPPELNSIILKCVEKRKEARWGRAQDVFKALEAFEALPPPDRQRP